MQTIKQISSLLLLFIGTLVFACTAPQSASNDTEEEKTERAGFVQEVQNPMSLADFLERASGVFVNGNQVSIRGAGPPLYVVDGVQVGFSYAKTNQMLNPDNIESVEVLKSPSETAIYGRLGQNGVIRITTFSG